MRLRTLFPTVALLFALPALARDNPRPVAPPAPPDQTRKAFSVADLVVPVSEANATQQQKNADALVRVVANTVRPYTWAANGGTGRVEFDERGSALVVHNTPAVVAEVERLLDALRQVQGSQIVYELRVLKTRSGFADRVKIHLNPGVELKGEQLRWLLDAAQGERETNILLAPKVTAFDGQSVTVRTGDERTFVTGAETAKAHGQVVLVPKSTSVFLGNVIELSGTAAPDDKSVQLRARCTRTYLNGEPEQLPVVTQVTPIFEGGSQGSPVPFTQHLQAPDIKTEKLDKTVTVPVNGTVVLGGWKEPAALKPGKAAPKLLPGKEGAAGYDVVVLATVRVLRPDAIDGTASRVYKLRNVAAVDVARAINDYARAAKFGALVVGDAVSNSVCVKCPAAEQVRIADLILALDKEPPQVVVQALVLEVPAGFMVKNGLTDGTEPSCVLSPREMQMFNALLRTAKEKGECDVVSRPQLCVGDGKPGFVQVGQLFPVTAAAGKVDYKHAGITLRVVPDIAPDGKSVNLTAELQHTKIEMNEAVTGAVVPAAAKSVPVFITQEVRGSVAVPVGHTVVFTTATAETCHALVTAAQRLCGRQTQTLVVLTPALVAPSAEREPAGK